MLSFTVTMFKLIVFILATWIVVDGRQFNNPVLAGADYPDPGVIKVDGVYYVVTTTNNQEPNKFPIHKSTDLQNWEFVGHVFNENNLPPYSNQFREYWAPELHRVGQNDYRVYFTTRDLGTNQLCIGAATSNNVVGPFVPTSQCLVLDTNQDALDSTLLNNNGDLFFFWKGREWMYGKKMNPDGLTFSSDQVFEVMRNDLPWEEAVIEAPFFIIRDDAFYMFYSGNGFCGDRYAVGVARSNNPFGPYEKRGDPIFASNENVKGPGHCSVVKDVDEVNYVMVYHGYVPGEVCDPWPRLTRSNSIGWGADRWPYMEFN